MKNLICLGIESTAHTFGVGICEKKGKKYKILCNITDSYKTEKGGIIPGEAAKHHANVKDALIEKALEEASLSMNNIDIIAYSRGPGLSPCLFQGLNAAKELASKHRKLLVAVNHCIAHLEIGKLTTNAICPVFLFVSGANTQIIAYASSKYRIFGETLDIGLGNALDKFGREAGFGFPSGKKIEELAKSGNYVELPYSVKGMDVSFSGIVTAAIKKVGKEKIQDLCFSLQENCFAMLTEVAERAMAHLKIKEALLIGGVAANKRFCEMLNIMCKERGAKFHAVKQEYAGDNGAMIAYNGLLQFFAGEKISPEQAEINPYERTDDVLISYLNQK